ncbi:unnamed protein product [Polarella glacialis]|uniref:Pseudouridine synthase RsuA/RluA-like domain-containing protein n=1 Tax=Polarella glacialis TaxID=89957 RepID=A0A813KZV4_POLGL|nr:unnamed protein product [Polarella glacialis]
MGSLHERMRRRPNPGRQFAQASQVERSRSRSSQRVRSVPISALARNVSLLRASSSNLHSRSTSGAHNDAAAKPAVKFPPTEERDKSRKLKQAILGMAGMVDNGQGAKNKEAEQLMNQKAILGMAGMVDNGQGAKNKEAEQLMNQKARLSMAGMVDNGQGAKNKEVDLLMAQKASFLEFAAKLEHCSDEDLLNEITAVRAAGQKDQASFPDEGFVPEGSEEIPEPADVSCEEMSLLDDMLNAEMSDIDDFDGDDCEGDDLDLDGDVDLSEDEGDVNLSEDANQKDIESCGPSLRFGYHWLAATDVQAQLAHPQAALQFRQRLATVLGSEIRDILVLWEHALVFDDCPPLVGFRHAQDAMLAMRSADLGDIGLKRIWTPESQRNGRLPKGAVVALCPCQEMAPQGSSEVCSKCGGVPTKYQRSIGSARDDYQLIFKAENDVEVEPTQGPKVALDHDGVLVVIKPAFWYPYLRENHRGGLVHRLDVQTSGPILIATQLRTFKFLRQSLHEHKFYKEYIALMHGALPPDRGTGVLDYRLLTLKDKGASWKTEVNEKGETAKTLYEALAVYQDTHKGKIEYYTLVRLQLLTGKTHQIRVHLQALAKDVGLPVRGIVGDYKYLSPDQCRQDKRLVQRVFLHAFRLHVPAPGRAGEMHQVRCALPPELKKTLSNMEVNEELTQELRRRRQLAKPVMQVDDGARQEVVCCKRRSTTDELVKTFGSLCLIVVTMS